jgi:hypothetical protein
MKLYAMISAICFVVAIALNLILEEKRNQISEMGLDPVTMGKGSDIL